MISSCNDCQRTHCLVKYCSEQSVQLLDKHKSEISYKKGELIFREGDPVQGIYIIFSGKVKVFNTGYHDKQQVVRLARDSHILGHRALGGIYYSVSAETIEDSVVCFIDNKIFNDVLTTEALLTYHLLFFCAEELRFAEARMKNLGQMTVREKAAEALLIINKTFGIENNNTVLLDADLSRKDIADIAGMRADQLIRILSEFKDENIISFQEKKIIILRLGELLKLIAPYYTVEVFH